MGKTREIPKQLLPKKKKARPKRLSTNSRLTPEEQARLDAFDAFIKRGEEQWAAMTPDERREELEGWERVKARINADRAGYRQVFVDD